jgi:hypothetical protein
LAFKTIAYSLSRLSRTLEPEIITQRQGVVKRDFWGGGQAGFAEQVREILADITNKGHYHADGLALCQAELHGLGFGRMKIGFR